MTIYEAIKHRRSVRNYLPAPVPPEVLGRIWEAVRAAPSACNLQPWRFLVLQSAAARQRVRGIIENWALTAPLLIVGLGNRNIAWRRDGESVHAIDVAIATEHLALAAAAEGLGTCWICAFDRNALRTALNLEPEWDPVVVMPLGYPNESAPRTDRKAVAEIVREL